MGGRSSDGGHPDTADSGRHPLLACREKSKNVSLNETIVRLQLYSDTNKILTIVNVLWVLKSPFTKVDEIPILSARVLLSGCLVLAERGFDPAISNE